MFKESERDQQTEDKFHQSRMKKSHVRNLNKSHGSLIPEKEDLDIHSEAKKQMETMDDKVPILKKEPLDDKDIGVERTPWRIDYT